MDFYLPITYSPLPPLLDDPALRAQGFICGHMVCLHCQQVFSIAVRPEADSTSLICPMCAQKWSFFVAE